MGIRERLEEIKNRRLEKETYERHNRIKEGYEQKKLSANERELIRRIEKEREKVMAKELEIIRRKEHKDFVSGKQNNPGYIKQVVKDDKKLFKHVNIFTKWNQTF